MKPRFNIHASTLAMFAMLLVAFLPSCAHDDPVYRYNPRAILTAIGNPVQDETYIYYKTAEATEAVEATEDQEAVEASPAQYAIALTESARSLIALPAPTAPEAGTITGIWNGGFRDSLATSFTIPDTVRVIDYEAFMNSRLATVTIPYSVTDIGEGAFYSCKDLTVARFNNSNMDGAVASSALTCDIQSATPVPEGEIKYSTLTEIPSMCFFNCASLKSLYLCQSITDISYEAFRGCVSMTSALAFASIVNIRARAFQDCVSIPTCSIPSSVFPDGTIEDKAFEGCYDKIEFYFSPASDEALNTWLTTHTKWGTSAQSKPYTYTRIAGGTTYTNDWIFQTINGEITITQYNGSDQITEEDGTKTNATFLTIPSSFDGVPVTRVARNFLDAAKYANFKKRLKRLYLPTSLKYIETIMFAGFDSLIVIDSTDKARCQSDSAAENPTPRIRLDGLYQLEVLGNRAFSRLPNIGLIQELYLPDALVAIGDFVFCSDSTTMPKLRKFRWNYHPDHGRLRQIGFESFFRLGLPSGTGTTLNTSPFPTVGKAKVGYDPAVVIFPSTFEGFIMTDAMRNTYSEFLIENRNTSSNDYAHGFAGTPLVSEIYFAGDENSPDLILGDETLAFNEAMRTVVFEERPNASILFYTNCGNWMEPCIGANAGRSYNDFRGDPYLQTLVLPTAETTLYMQDCSLMQNSRAAMYCSGAFTDNFGVTILGDGRRWTTNPHVDADITALKHWYSIGNEEFYNAADGSCKGYPGYCFAENLGSNANAIINGTAVAKTGAEDTGYKNSFGLDQKMPVHENVYFRRAFSSYPSNMGIASSTVIEVGDPTSTHKYAEVGDFAFVTAETAANEATMTKYLYDRYGDGVQQATGGTAIVPNSITVDGTAYSVTKIGDSAFSACYSDTTDRNLYSASEKYDLTRVLLPDCVVTIGQYAFLRCYALVEIATYTGNYSPDPENLSTIPAGYTAAYKMPSSLRFVDKLAFAFINVPKFLLFPTACAFYENKTKDFLTPSVFCNNLSLRLITFVKEEIYMTTKYTSTHGDERTCALYCKGSGSVSYNKNRLQIILNRDPEDGDVTNDTDFPGTGDKAGWFNGQYQWPNSPYLYGAYKMAGWIRKLTCGKATTSWENKTYDQALFSAVGRMTRDGNDKIVATDYPIYLCAYVKPFGHDDNKCNLDAIGGKVLTSPGYAYRGCERLVDVHLPTENNAQIPSGVFSSIENPLNFYSPDVNGDEQDRDGELNLTYCNYKGIGAEAFKDGTTVTGLIASNHNGFSIGASAFENCTTLTSIDFSLVTGKLTIEASAFKGCTSLNSITWPSSSSTQVEIKTSAFQGCTALTEITLPKNTKFHPGNQTKGYQYVFADCANLTSVSTIEGDTGSNDLWLLPMRMFQNCVNLSHLDWDLFPSVKEIDQYCFENAGPLTDSGTLELPSRIKGIWTGAFKGCRVVNFIIPATDTGTLAFGDFAFLGCPELVGFYYKGKSTEWKSGNTYQTVPNGKLWASCPKLTTLFFAEGFHAYSHSCSANKSFVLNSPNARIFHHNKVGNINNGVAYMYTDVNTRAPIYWRADTRADVTSMTDNYWFPHAATDVNPLDFYVLGVPESSTETSVTFAQYILSTVGGVTTCETISSSFMPNLIFVPSTIPAH